MSLVATLICNPANPALDSTVVDGARAVLPKAAPAHWLFDGVAVDIPFGADSNLEGDRHAIEQRLRELRGDLPIDIVVQPVGFEVTVGAEGNVDCNAVEQPVRGSCLRQHGAGAVDDGRVERGTIGIADQRGDEGHLRFS